ncbi:tRNA (guanine-N7-)-methyltransferase [Phytomonospora endophytica]|uniref:tRNA (guanine-N(7)-)-methyltransferase n=2 Tax=Phytomonospora endophytica TaxID=714109 RepID=A0A841FLL2_9ACTN|nr:tRNA (guanine-N7-)-methyltransferase [Phytomonospora endophytica]
MSTESVPAEPRMARVRTFQPRRGRVSDRHEDALARLLPVYGVDESFEAATAFGRSAPLILEIGSGMGQATAEMAAADPGRDYLAVEVHPPGIANLLWLVEERGLRNVRVFDGDALDFARGTLPEASLAALHVYFPDPWPKPRHHKRRIIQAGHVELLRSRLAPGGVFHCATDWAEYAERMLKVLTADPELENTAEGFAARPGHRPVTKFERRGVAAGREIFDLVFRRVQGGSATG